MMGWREGRREGEREVLIMSREGNKRKEGL